MSSIDNCNEIEDDYFHTYGVYVGYVDSESIPNFYPPDKNFVEKVTHKVVNKDESPICLLLIYFQYDNFKKKYFVRVIEDVRKKHSNIFDKIHDFEDSLQFNLTFNRNINKISEKSTEVNFINYDYETDPTVDDDDYVDGTNESFEFEKFGHLYLGSFELGSREVITMFIGEKSKHFSGSKIERPLFRFRFVSFRSTEFNSKLFM